MGSDLIIAPPKFENFKLLKMADVGMLLLSSVAGCDTHSKTQKKYAKSCVNANESGLNQNKLSAKNQVVSKLLSSVATCWDYDLI